MYYDKNKYLTQTETIKYLGITYTKLELLMYDELDVIKFGSMKLFKKEQLDKLIERKLKFKKRTRMLEIEKEPTDKKDFDKNILDILTSQEPNISITINREDLMMFGKFLIEESRKDMEAFLQAKNEEEYLTKKEVASILHVDVSTLWNWDKKGYLKPIEIGGSRLYKKSEINKVLNK